MLPAHTLADFLDTCSRIGRRLTRKHLLSSVTCSRCRECAPLAAAILARSCLCCPPLVVRPARGLRARYCFAISCLFRVACAVVGHCNGSGSVMRLITANNSGMCFSRSRSCLLDCRDRVRRGRSYLRISELLDNDHPPCIDLQCSASHQFASLA